MSHAQFNLSPDLKRLRDEGYFVQIQGGFLVLREVPTRDGEDLLSYARAFLRLNDEVRARFSAPEVSGPVVRRRPRHFGNDDELFALSAKHIKGAILFTSQNVHIPQ